MGADVMQLKAEEPCRARLVWCLSLILEPACISIVHISTAMTVCSIAGSGLEHCSSSWSALCRGSYQHFKSMPSVCHSRHRLPWPSSWSWTRYQWTACTSDSQAQMLPFRSGLNPPHSIIPSFRAAQVREFSRNAILLSLFVRLLISEIHIVLSLSLEPWPYLRYQSSPRPAWLHVSAKKTALHRYFLRLSYLQPLVQCICAASPFCSRPFICRPRHPK
jgi:hypothetical protein